MASLSTNSNDAASAPLVSKIEAAQQVVSATDNLTEALAKLAVTSEPGRLVLTDSVVIAILRWLEPLEYHVVAPLVNKQWRRCIRRDGRSGWKPRVVLLNLRVVLPDHQTAGAPQHPPVADIELPKPKILITHPAPLDHWTVLPEEYAQATQTRMAGEGISVQTTLENAPRDPDRVREFLNGVLAMLIRRVRWWCERMDALEPSGNQVASSVCPSEYSDEDGDAEEDDARLANAPNVSLVPWQVTLIGCGKKAGNLDALSDLLAGFAPHVVEMHQPPENILNHLVAASTAPIHVLKLTGIGKDDLPDLTRIGQLQNLVCLELSGRTDVGPTTPLSDVAHANHFCPLAELAGSLRELRIGCGYPIPQDQYRSLVQHVLLKLTSLRILFIDKLLQESPAAAAIGTLPAVGVDPALLAKLIFLPHLEELYCLKNITPEFFAAVGTPPRPAPVLRTLSVYYESLTSPDDLRAALVLFAKHFPYVTRLSLNLNLALSARQVLDVLAEAKKWPGLDWKDVVIEQIPMTVQNIALWGRLNIAESSSGFAIRWKGVR
ncbi:hypothetical protein HDU86_001555 [Geranomyces michiganensis]|nr:hypothetical protein HDU86_001555 [Geranomyces michiganensis]